MVTEHFAFEGRANRPAARSVAGRSLAAAIPVAVPRVSVPVAKTATTAEAPRDSAPTSARARDIVVTPPASGSGVLSAVDEGHLLDLIRNPLSMADPITRKVNPDGSVDLFAKTPDGQSVYQHINPQGDLTKENLAAADPGAPGAESMYRSFYESGEIKSLAWNRANGASTTVNFAQSGSYETRYDRLPDGTAVSIEYDDLGGIKKIWRLGKDGKPLPGQ